jgi:hypothetical protein
MIFKISTFDCLSYCKTPSDIHMVYDILLHEVYQNHKERNISMRHRKNPNLRTVHPIGSELDRELEEYEPKAWQMESWIRGNWKICLTN